MTASAILAFSPARMAGPVLDAVTVGAGPALELLDQALRSPGKGVVLLGPPGAGKTHLLSMALDRLDADPSFAVAWFLEAAYGTGSYLDLLHDTAGQLVGPGWLPPRSDVEMRAMSEQALEAHLTAALDGRTLVLAIERLDALLRSLGPAGVAKLAAMLTDRQAVLLGSSSRPLPGWRDVDAPLRGLLALHRLGPWTAEEAREYLLRAAGARGDQQLVEFAATDRCIRRLRAIEALAGGLPRVYALIATQHLPAQAIEEVTPALLGVIDRLTPHYQGLMRRVAPSKVALLARLGRSGSSGGPMGALPVKDLARDTHMSGQAAAAALGQLEADGYVRSFKAAKGDQRVTFYELDDPLLRLWLAGRAMNRTFIQMIEGVRDYHETAGAARRHEQTPPAPAEVAKLVGELIESGQAGSLLGEMRKALPLDQEERRRHLELWQTALLPWAAAAGCASTMHVLDAAVALMDGKHASFFALPPPQRPLAVALAGPTGNEEEALRPPRQEGWTPRRPPAHMESAGDAAAW